MGYYGYNWRPSSNLELVIIPIYPYGRGNGGWYGRESKCNKLYQKLHERFRVFWHGVLSLQTTSFLRGYKVVKQPKPKSTFKAWRYKRGHFNKTQ